MANVLVPLAEGCEEMEAVIIIDVLRRAGWTVVPASISGAPVVASRGVVLMPDTLLSELNPSGFDLLAIPGGSAGADRLRRNEDILRIIRRFDSEKKIIAAICAGPLVLQEAGALQQRLATCHPGVRAALRGDVSDDRVVVDDHVVTSQGPGTAFEFALTLIRLVDGEQAAATVAEGLILPR